jgi:hypothetical protein
MWDTAYANASPSCFRLQGFATNASMQDEVRYFSFERETELMTAELGQTEFFGVVGFECNGHGASFGQGLGGERGKQDESLQSIIPANGA